jgi:hypothetical protein
VQVNPAFQAIADGPPVTVLFHELAHAYDQLYGTGVEGTYAGADNTGVANGEREAVGLPIDVDGDPATPPAPAPRHPPELTENALRAELGVAARTAY